MRNSAAGTDWSNNPKALKSTECAFSGTKRATVPKRMSGFRPLGLADFARYLATEIPFRITRIFLAGKPRDTRKSSVACDTTATFDVSGMTQRK
jgi:hypothetical protein